MVNNDRNTLYQAEESLYLHNFSHQGFEWIDIERMHEVPHPSYVRKALKFIG